MEHFAARPGSLRSLCSQPGMLAIEAETASLAPAVIGIASALAAIRSGRIAANTNLKMGT